MQNTMQGIDVTPLDFLAYGRSGGRAGRRAGVEGEVSNLCLGSGQKDNHQHVNADSTDHTHKHKGPGMDVKVHPARLNAAVGSVNRRLPQEEPLQPHFLPSDGAAVQSAPPLAEGRRVCGGKRNCGGSEGTLNKHLGAESWRRSSRAAAPLTPELSLLGLAYTVVAINFI